MVVGGRSSNSKSNGNSGNNIKMGSMMMTADRRKQHGILDFPSDVLFSEQRI